MQYKIRVFGKKTVLSERIKSAEFFDVKSTEIEQKLRLEKLFTDKKEKNRYSQNFRRIFKNFYASFIVNRRYPKCRKNSSSISAKTCEIIEKSDFKMFFFDFLLKIRIF